MGTNGQSRSLTTESLLPTRSLGQNEGDYDASDKRPMKNGKVQLARLIRRFLVFRARTLNGVGRRGTGGPMI
jgi:hypothetical protein